MLAAVQREISAGRRENFGTVDRAHNLPTARGYSGTHEHAIKVNALVSQWVAFINADDRWYQPLHIGCRKTRLRGRAARRRQYRS